MAHGANAMLKKIDGKSGVGSRRIFPPHFKLQVLDSYRNDADCKGNQRATARKYGIHRRQIQKWLQVEGNLRNSVRGKEEAKKCEAALRPDEPSLPLDFTTHDRAVHASPSVASLPASYPASPIDLSLKRPPPHRTPVRSPPSPAAHSSSPRPAPSPTRHHRHHHHHHRGGGAASEPDVWDLSTKRRSDQATAPSKPVKLFKPYLDDVYDETTRTSEENNVASYLLAPNSPYDYYNNNNNNNGGSGAQNNNNNVYDTYTIQELHPKNSIIYYYPLYPLYPSPEPPFSTTPPYDGENSLLPKRQTYSLDFKLNAIDSYHRDEFCKGNQRAVATKYNIHRRQVQKWLQQEEELRQRSDKQVHVVS